MKPFSLLLLLQVLFRFSTTAFSPPNQRHADPISTKRSRRTNKSPWLFNSAAEPSEVMKAAVRRQYETFDWTFKSEGTSEEKSYKINYRVEGPKEGNPILLIHGFGGNVNHFRYNIPLLVEEGYRVYAIDLLGFGASEKPKEADFSMELFIQQVCDFMEMCDEQKPWTVCGNSIGGVVSLGVAATLKQKVQAVVLFNCAGGMSGFRYEDVPWIFRPIMYFVQTVVLGPANGPNFFKNFKSTENVESILKTQGVYGDTSNVDEELLEIILGPSEDEGAEEVFLQVFAGPAGPPPEHFLPQISCPILALWGEKDPWTPAENGRKPSGSMFGEYTKDFTLDLIPGAGHCPMDECPEYCHKSMVPFLDAARERYDPAAAVLG